MAKIESGDVKLSLGATVGGAGGNVSSQLAFGQGLNALARGTQQIQDVSQAAAFSFATRQNERHYQEAEIKYREFKSDLLYGKDGLLFKQGSNAEGITEASRVQIQEYVQAQMPTIGNRVVREAFQTFVSKDMIDTTSLLARDEANKLEGVRRSNAGALHVQAMREASLFDQSKLLPTEMGGDTEVLADLVTATEERIATWQPDLSQAEVENIARKEMANAAQTAVMALMDNGAQNAGAANSIIRFWGTEWDPKAREAITGRVQDEVVYNELDNLVANAARDLGPTFSDKEIIAASVDALNLWHNKLYGSDPNSSYVEEAKRRARVFNQDLDNHLSEQRTERRDGEAVNLFKAMQSGDRTAAEVMYKSLVKSANGANDLEFLGTIQKIYNSFRTEGSLFPSKPTLKGLEMYYDGSAGKNRSEVLLAAAEMPQNMWEAYSNGHLANDKILSSGTTAVEDALDAVRNIKTGKGKYSTKQKKNPDYTSRYFTLDRLQLDFAKREKRVATSDELQKMAFTLETSLDDRGRDDGFSGSLVEFLRNPTAAKKLSTSDKKDKALLDLAIAAADEDPKAAAIVLESLGINAPLSTLSAEALAANPEIAARLIEFGITSSETFRFNLNSAVLEKSK